MDKQEIILHGVLKERLDLFAAKKLRIRNKDGYPVPFIFNPEQKYAYSVLQLLRKRKKPAPTLARIYKCRKRGMSSLSMADMLHTYQYSDRIGWGEIYGHVKDASRNLYDMLDLFYDSIPEKERKRRTKSTVDSLRYADGTQINVRTVGSRGQGRSGTPDYVVFTECAFYGDDTASILSSVQSSVPRTPYATIIEESTSNGFDSYWYPAWKDSEDEIKRLVQKHSRTTRCTRKEELKGINAQYKLLANDLWGDRFFPVFIPWFWNPENALDPEASLYEEMTDYEKEIKETYDLTYRQLAWRRYIKENTCKNDESLTKQEHPCSIEESFISSGRPFFDPIEKVDVELMKAVALPEATDSEVVILNNIVDPRERGLKGKLVQSDLYFAQGKAPKEVSLDRWSGIQKTEVDPLVKENAGWWVEYQPPEKDWTNRYVIGVDVAQGLAQSDFDTILVFDRAERKFVAMMMDRVGIDTLPWRITMAAVRYNFADVLVERNKDGTAVLLKLTSLYPNVMTENRTSRGFDEYTSTVTYGFSSTPESKNRILHLLKEYYGKIPKESDGTYIPFNEVWKEMRSFVRGPRGELSADGKMTNPATRNYDDLVMAAALALEGDRILNVTGISPHKKKISSGYKFGGTTWSPPPTRHHEPSRRVI